MSEIAIVRLLGDLVKLQKETLEEIKGLRVDMAAEASMVTQIDLVDGAVTRLPQNCWNNLQDAKPNTAGNC